MKRNKGITLIALVITIIVLLILAGVAIAMLSGENGILKKAAESKTKTEEASFLEQVKIAIMGAIINKDAKIDEETLKTELGNLGVKEKDIVSDGNGGYIVKKENNSVNIKKDGNVESLEGISDEDIELEKYFLANNSKYKCRYGYITGFTLNEEGKVEETVEEFEKNLAPLGYKVDLKYDRGQDKDIEIEDKSNTIVATAMSIQKDGKTIAKTVVFGDIHCDGKISAADITLYNKYLRGEINPQRKAIKAAMDINNDRKNDITDLTLIQAFASKRYKKINQNRYTLNPDTIIDDMESYQIKIYTNEVSNNIKDSTVYSFESEIDNEQGIVYYELKINNTGSVKTEELLTILPANSKIKRNGEKVAATENVQTGDEIIYTYNEREFYIGKIVVN